MTSEDKSINSISQILYNGLASGENSGKDEDYNLEKKPQRYISDADKYKTEKITELQRQKFIDKVENLMNKYKSANLIRKKDKLMFLIGVFRLIFEAFLLGRAPCYYTYYYSITICFLFFCRVIYYRWLNWHYFLFDFCYFANLMTLIFLWVYPENEFLFISCYGFSMGPLISALIIFKNSMVIHSLDKITSVFIHLAPGQMFWGIRSSECDCWKVSKITPSYLEYILYPTLLYLLWAVCYYLILFKLAYKRCEKNNRYTLFKWVMENEKSIYYKVCKKLGYKNIHLSFMLTHMIFTLPLLFITYIAVYNHYLQFLILCLCMLRTCWLAANYYMEIFTKNYELNLEKLENIKKTFNPKNS